jgi:chemotaxis protein CheX
MLEVSPSDIESIVCSIFDATFGMTIERLEGANDAPFATSSSLIGISGSWDGAVILDCAPDVAVELATLMFDLPLTAIDRTHIEDTLGELANMVGGNLKCLLPPPCSLSLPTVVEGRDYRVRVPGATIVRDLHFALARGRLRVLVAERGLSPSR